MVGNLTLFPWIILLFSKLLLRPCSIKKQIPNYCRPMARAKVKISTSFALFCKRILAHSFTVAPVVKTSSTRRIFLFFILSGLFILKAFLTFLLRSAPLKPVWAQVHWCRSKTWGSILSCSLKIICGPVPTPG